MGTGLSSRWPCGHPDLVIALKFPVYLAPFPNKKVWLLHQFRQVYDLWGSPHQSLPHTPEAKRVRQMVIQADNAYLREARSIYTNSRIVANRLRTHNGITPDGVLYPPLLHPEKFRLGEFGDYFFYPSRLNAMKRQHLAIAALSRTRSRFRLVLAGKADDETYLTQLQELIRTHGLEERVQLLGWVSEDEKARWVSGATGILNLPYDEDSYGYVSLEAFQACKPVLTCTDSGGTHELVSDGANGLIVEPSPDALAVAMEQLWADQKQAARMGQEGFETVRRNRIEWPHILERLVA